MYRLVWIGAAVGAVALAGVLVWMWVAPALSVETGGTILSIRTTAQNTECCPVTVEFEDGSGRTHSFSSASGGNRQQQVGDEITVFYDQDDPTQAQTGKDRVTPLAVGGFGVFVLTLVSISYFFVDRRNRS